MANQETDSAIDGAGFSPGALIEAMRPKHWIKNAFVAAPILFANLIGSAEAWALCSAAVGAFCLLSSSVYLINDVCDRRADREHPTKRNRPVASGRLSVAAAVAAAAVLAAGGLGIAAVVSWLHRGRAASLYGWGPLVWTGGYFALNLAYSTWLKNKSIIDVICVALGFVLRAMAGAAAIDGAANTDVPISPWLVVCTLTLCLFIALTKRRYEVTELSAETAAAARSVNAGYRTADLEHMQTVSTAMAILTYCLYCLAPSTVARLGSANMVWTIPLVIYGMFRYNVQSRRLGKGDPVAVLLADRVMWLVLGLYAVVSALVIRYGAVDALRGVLDTGAGGG
jgi:4-hydroxybenzoate polyprenyltransferase